VQVSRRSFLAGVVAAPLPPIGLLGFFMRRYGWPVAPAVIGLTLGPIAETNLRRALAISGGDLSVLVDSWVSRIVMGLAFIALVGAIVLRLVHGPRATPEEVQQEGTLQRPVPAGHDRGEDDVEEDR
jgi:putative tricarboxylic transport membrane protein